MNNHPTSSQNTWAKPFLKWAGGKGQLLTQIVELLPAEIHTGKITKYVEPFIGGGALYFYIAQHCPAIETFLISDFNQELFLAYKTIQQDVEGVIDCLKALDREYQILDQPARKDFFYDRRLRFNKILPNIDFVNFQSNWIERVATIIFLNRTCFNGLFRVNSKGEFNVPFGDYKNPKICDAENLRPVSNLLQKTEIRCGDFSQTSDFIDEKTFVYFDPPYRPLNKTASFTAYSKSQFNDQEQIRLAEYYSSLANKRALLMLSNSDPKNEDKSDNFFDDLYDKFTVNRVGASRAINSNSSKRGKITEILVTNYSIQS
ncbi:MAG: adenine-specific methylase [Cyanobacteriota bacterium]